MVGLMQQFPGEYARIVSGTRDGALSILEVSADADPGTFYLFDSKARKLTPLLAEAHWIDPTQMATKQPFDFSARDGMKLQGYVSYPPGDETAKHLPTVAHTACATIGITTPTCRRWRRAATSCCK